MTPAVRNTVRALQFAGLAALLVAAAQGFALRDDNSVEADIDALNTLMSLRTVAAITTAALAFLTAVLLWRRHTLPFLGTIIVAAGSVICVVQFAFLRDAPFAWWQCLAAIVAGLAAIANLLDGGGTAKPSRPQQS